MELQEYLPAAYFNPRSLAGATRWSRLVRIRRTFQSTLPCGSDIRLMLQESLGSYFNPRSLAGATRTAYTRFFIIDKFQSTLPCGSDLRLRSPYSPQQNFNPRSLAGATATIDAKRLAARISIHAPLRERLYHMFQHHIS